MKTPSRELLELCMAVHESGATAGQVRRLESLLTDDPEARRFYLRFAQISASLERFELDAQLSPLPETRSAVPPPKPSRSRRWLILSCLALAGCVAVLLVMLGRSRVAVPAGKLSPSSSLVAVVQDAHNVTLISANGNRRQLSGDHRLMLGDVIATGHQGAAVLRMQDERTLFFLAADTRLWLGNDSSAKVVHLAYGNLACDVAKQTDGKPWRIVTTDGEATVLGTRLAVTVGGRGSRVAVTSGLVRVTSRDSRESVETPAGYATEFTPTTAVRSKLPLTAPTRVLSFTLVDADTNAPIPGYDVLPDGAVLDLATLPTRRLNIRANCDPMHVGGVVFRFEGVDSAGRPIEIHHPAATNGFPNSIETMYPHMLAGDASLPGMPLPSNSNAWTPPPGRYVLEATPYAGYKSSGARGESLSIRFEVVERAR